MLTAHRAPSSRGGRTRPAAPAQRRACRGRARARWCGRLLPRRPQKHTINDLAKSRNRNRRRKRKEKGVDVVAVGDCQMVRRTENPQSKAD